MTPARRLSRRSCKSNRPARLLATWLGLAALSSGAHATVLFDDGEPLRITLEAPLGEIARDRTGEPQWHDARLVHHAADGAETEFEIRVRARGKNRRKADVCRFPPLRLDFDRKQAAGTAFDGQNKLKLVTHCQGSSRFEQYVLRELLVYRLYNRLSDCSFRVHELRVIYNDTGKRKNRDHEYLGFLIEDRDDVAERCGGSVARLEKIGRNELDPAIANLYEVFQFMIGNTDWSTLRGPQGDRCCHNGVLVEMDGGGLVPVPYDFDASGFVDAPYAAPSEKLGIDKVTTRLYRGFCRPAEVVDATIARYNAERESFYAIVREQAGISKHTMSSITRYLDRFYDTINDPKRRQKEIDNGCR